MISTSEINISEFNEQAALVDWLDALIASNQPIKYSAIPNSTYTKSWAQKTKNKQSGLRAGLPDMFLIVNNQAFFIEMKRKKKGRVSDSQEEWIEAINKTEIKAYICFGFDEARKVVENYLNSF